MSMINHDQRDQSIVFDDVHVTLDRLFV